MESEQGYAFNFASGFGIDGCCELAAWRGTVHANEVFVELAVALTQASRAGRV